MLRYLGGYYLIKLRPLDFGSGKGGSVYTASDCINDNLVAPWEFPSNAETNIETIGTKEKFGLDYTKVRDIRNWAAIRQEQKKFGRINVFSKVESARAYGRAFFSHLDDIKLLGLYFDEGETKDLMGEFENEGANGLYETLSKRVIEAEDRNETFIGYDLIGVEYGGDFHSFHCHDIGAELSEKFGLRVNEFGLFEAHDDWKPVLEYLNDEGSGCEPVPWFVAKTKLVNVNQ